MSESEKTVKKARTRFGLSPVDFVVHDFPISDKEREKLAQHLINVHTAHSFLSKASLLDVRKLLIVESSGKARVEMMHRIIGRLGVLTNAFFKAKLRLSGPKLTKTKKQESGLI